MAVATSIYTSIFIDQYHIYYSTVDGEIYEFEKMNASGEYHPIEENFDDELVKVARDVITNHQQPHQDEGFPAFIYKLAEEGRIEIPIE